MHLKFVHCISILLLLTIKIALTEDPVKPPTTAKPHTSTVKSAADTKETAGTETQATDKKTETQATDTKTETQATDKKTDDKGDTSKGEESKPDTPTIPKKPKRNYTEVSDSIEDPKITAEIIKIEKSHCDSMINDCIKHMTKLHRHIKTTKIQSKCLQQTQGFLVCSSYTKADADTAPKNVEQTETSTVVTPT